MDLKKQNDELICQLKSGLNNLRRLTKPTESSLCCNKSRSFCCSPPLKMRNEWPKSINKSKRRFSQRRNIATSTPKLSTGNILERSLNDEGNRRVRKVTSTAQKSSENNPLKSILNTTERKILKRKNRVNFVPIEENPAHDSKLNTSMLGYDWIAGMLDNKFDDDNKSEEYFKEIQNFRKLNKEECGSNKSLLRSPKVDLKAVSKYTGKENSSFTCNGSSYIVNRRLNLIPIHGPYSECDTCKTKSGYESKDDQSLIRVSIPLSDRSLFKVKTHRRKSFEPSDSVSLSMHCLTGWQNSKPALAPGPKTIDLQSHVSNGNSSNMRHAELLFRNKR